QAERRGCAQRNRYWRPDQFALVADPPAARLDLARVGLAMNAFLAARLELEMLYGIGDIDGRPVDPGLFERGIEQLAGGADERAPRKILLIAGLPAYEHDRRVKRSLPKHCLRRMSVQVAARA